MSFILIPLENRKEISVMKLNIIPRLIRLRDAPTYLGMNRNLFNAEIRPTLKELRIGKQGIAFDRIDLDEWVESYKNSIDSKNSSTIKIKLLRRNLIKLLRRNLIKLLKKLFL